MEDLAQALLGLSELAAHDLGAGNVEKPGLSFVRYRAGEKRLACSRRSVQEHALGRINTETLKQLRVGAAAVPPSREPVQRHSRGRRYRHKSRLRDVRP